MDTMNQMLSLWSGAGLAEKDGFWLQIGGGSLGLPWWDRHHVSRMLDAFRRLDRDQQQIVLGRFILEDPLDFDQEELGQLKAAHQRREN